MEFGAAAASLPHFSLLSVLLLKTMFREFGKYMPHSFNVICTFVYIRVFIQNIARNMHTLIHISFYIIYYDTLLKNSNRFYTLKEDIKFVVQFCGCNNHLLL